MVLMHSHDIVSVTLYISHFSGYHGRWYVTKNGRLKAELAIYRSLYVTLMGLI